MMRGWESDRDQKKKKKIKITHMFLLSQRLKEKTFYKQFL